MLNPPLSAVFLTSNSLLLAALAIIPLPSRAKERIAFLSGSPLARSVTTPFTERVLLPVLISFRTDLYPL
ncbi:MAG: hypothetical protein AAB347_00090 [Bacteroidota bacterium]